jgi:predicted transcriptional regulator
MADTPKRKAMTLRLDTETAEQLEALAQVVREALARHIEQRRADADFQKRLRDSVERNQAILKRLAT